jgi:hypothetical protein
VDSIKFVVCHCPSNGSRQFEPLFVVTRVMGVVRIIRGQVPDNAFGLLDSAASTHTAYAISLKKH